MQGMLFHHFDEEFTTASYSLVDCITVSEQLQTLKSSDTPLSPTETSLFIYLIEYGLCKLC